MPAWHAWWIGVVHYADRVSFIFLKWLVSRQHFFKHYLNAHGCAVSYVSLNPRFQSFKVVSIPFTMNNWGQGKLVQRRMLHKMSRIPWRDIILYCWSFNGPQSYINTWMTDVGSILTHNRILFYYKLLYNKQNYIMALLNLKFFKFFFHHFSLPSRKSLSHRFTF